MTSVLAERGEIVIPKEIRDQLELSSGDDFQIYVESGEIVLRPLPRERNAGLAELLSTSPGTLEIPERNTSDFKQTDVKLLDPFEKA